jgi:hypothetical protein
MTTRRRARAFPQPNLKPIPVKGRNAALFQRNFRFEKADFKRLFQIYAIPKVIVLSNGVNVPRWDALGIFLRRLATAGTWNLHVDFFGRSVRVMSGAFYAILELVFAACHERVTRPARSFLTTERLLAYSDAIHKYA